MASAENQALKSVRTWGWLAVILLAHVPLVVVHFDHLWETGIHPHFPLLLVAALLLLWSRWEGTRQAGRWQSFFSLLLLGCGFTLLLMGALSVSPWLGYVATLITTAAMLLQFCPAPFKQWGPAWMLLWLLVPLPMTFDRHVALELQSDSSWAASLILDFFQMNHLRIGNTIEVPGMKFAVDDPSGGIPSLYVLIAVSATLAVVLRHGWLHTFALMTSAAAWAAVANMIRVVGVVIAATQWKLDLSTGWGHKLWELILFFIAFGLILSTDRLLLLLFSPAEEGESLEHDDFEEPVDDSFDQIRPHSLEHDPEEREDYDPTESEEVPGRELGVGSLVARSASRPDVTPVARGAGGPSNIVPAWIVAGMFACLGLAQAVPHPPAPQQPISAAALAISELVEDTLPAELSAWRRVRFETKSHAAGGSEAEFSAIWHFERDGREAIVTLEYPFSCWHQLTQSYRSRGCRVRDWHLETTASENAQLAVASLDLENARSANLLFVEWDHNGKILTPPVTEGPSFSQLMTDLKHRCAGARDANCCVYLLQVLSPARRDRPGVAATTIEDDDAALRRLLAESLELLRTRTTTAPGGAT